LFIKERLETISIGLLNYTVTNPKFEASVMLAYKFVEVLFKAEEVFVVIFEVVEFVDLFSNDETTVIEKE